MIVVVTLPSFALVIMMQKILLIAFVFLAVVQVHSCKKTNSFRINIIFPILVYQILYDSISVVSCSADQAVF